MTRTRREGPGGHPAFVTGLVRFEFWNNDDEAYRDRALKELAKDARQALNISAIHVTEDGAPETGQIAFAGAARSREKAEALATEVMDYLDKHAPARVVADNWIAEEIP